MQTIKITIEQDLFAQLEELAHILQVSPSEAMALALKEWIRRKRIEQITRQINESYSKVLSEEELKEEQAWRRFGQRAFLKVADEW